MPEQFINFETAKLAKEKGFAEPVDYCYDVLGNLIQTNISQYRNDIDVSSAPTQTHLQKWLREEQNYFITVDYNPQFQWYFYHGFSYTPLKHINYNRDTDEIGGGGVRNNTYEQALELGLRASLKII